MNTEWLHKSIPKSSLLAHYNSFMPEAITDLPFIEKMTESRYVQHDRVNIVILTYNNIELFAATLLESAKEQ